MARPTKHRRKWRIRWFDENGRRRSEVYADFRRAESALHQREVEVEDRRQGLRPPAPPVRTFNELFDYWLTKRAPAKRSGDDDASIIRAHLRPAFGALRLAALGPEQVDHYILDRRHLAPQTVRNHLTLLVTLTGVAVELAWLRERPRIRKPRVRLFAEEYRWLRSDDELHRFLSAARDEGERVLTLYAVAAFTGMRAGEIAALRWEDVDFERRLVTVQRSYHGPTKAGDLRHVPILDPLLPLLRSWRLRCPDVLVFPNQAGRMHEPSARIFHEALRRVLSRGGFEPIERRGKRIPYITFHSLRHTFASHWVMRGGEIFKLQKILGHKSIQMTLRYAHLQPAAFKDDYGRLGGAGTLAHASVVPIGSAPAATA